MSYGVSLTNPAQRDLRNLDPQIQDDALDELASIGDDLEIGGTLEGCPNSIRKYEFEDLSVSGEWRAAYIILDNERFCSVFAIGPRENFYDKVKRRARQVLRQL